MSAAASGGASRHAAAPDEAGLAPELRPGPSESPQAYLERLRAHHARVGSLIETIEAQRPGAPRRHRDRGGDRRYLDDERRTGDGERRTGVPETRTTWQERRQGARDRRRWRVPRREGLDRRRNPPPVPWRGGLRADRVTGIWALQVLAWLAIFAAILAYGLR